MATVNANANAASYFCIKLLHFKFYFILLLLNTGRIVERVRVSIDSRMR